VGEAAGVGERDEPLQVGVVASMGQIALGLGQQLEQAALRIVEDYTDRNALSTKPWGGKGHGEALRCCPGGSVPDHAGFPFLPVLVPR